MLEALLRNLWNGIKGDTKRFFRNAKEKFRDSLNNDMPTTSFCTECGSKIPVGSMFCMECGGKVNVNIQSQNKSAGNNRRVLILILIVALLLIVPMFKKDSRTELKDMIYLTEKEVASMFKMEETEWGMYPNSDYPIFWCIDGKVNNIGLSINSDPEHKYELCGIVVGDNYKESIKKLENTFEKKMILEYEGLNKVVLVEKQSNNDLTLYYDDNDKIEYISYSIAMDEYMSDEEITESSKAEDITNSVIVENYTEVNVDDGLINQIQYDGTAGIVQELMNANRFFIYDIYYVRSLPTTGEVMGLNLERCTMEYFSSYQDYVDFVHAVYTDEEADYFIDQAKYFSVNGVLCLNTAFDSGVEEVHVSWNVYTINILYESYDRVDFEVSTLNSVGSVVTRQGTMVGENGYWKLTEPVW